ncbi:MAG: hypothetical protein AAGA15_08835 [Pseudomonadota bacterium]
MAAQAECPAADDLAGGVAFVRDTGALELHRDLGEGIISMGTLTEAGELEPQSGRLRHGVYLMESRDGASVVRYTWPAGLETLPYPQLAMSEDLALIISQQGFEFPAIFNIAVGDTPARLRLGECELEMWGIRTEVTLDDTNGFSTFFYWFPRLGTGVPVRWSTNGEVTESVEIVGLEW